MRRAKKLCVEGKRASSDQDSTKEDNVPVECLSLNVQQLFNEDAGRLTHLLPEDIWQLILGRMEQEDVEHCVNTSPFFWELRKKNRTVYLFDKVIGIMALLLGEKNFGIQVPRKRHLDEDVIVENWKSSVLKFRLVCSAWNKAVEKCYEKAEMTGIQEFVKDLDPRSSLSMLCCEFKFQSFASYNHSYHPLGFLEKFEESHGPGNKNPKNPFFGRKVFIHLGEPVEVAEREEYYNALFRILELFGGEIWYCNIVEALRFSTPAQVASKIHQILGLLPNLEHLSLSSFSEFYALDMFVQTALPTLEKLESLHFDQLSSPVATELIRRNGNIQFLHICHSEVDVNCGSLLTNLTGYSTTYSDNGDEVLARFGHKWQLQNVQINQRRELGVVQLFPFLHNCWAETLTDFNLVDPFSTDEVMVLAQSKNLRLNLFCVRRPTIRSFHVFFMDFALPLNKALEHLKIYIHARWITGKSDWDKVKKEQTIELIGFRRKMHRSNIWNYFGNMKTIELVCEEPNLRDQIFLYTKEGNKLVYVRKS